MKITNHSIKSHNFSAGQFSHYSIINYTNSIHIKSNWISKHQIKYLISIRTSNDHYTIEQLPISNDAITKIEITHTQMMKPSTIDKTQITKPLTSFNTNLNYSND